MPAPAGLVPTRPRSTLPAAIAVFTSRPESNCFQLILTPIALSNQLLADDLGIRDDLVPDRDLSGLRLSPGQGRHRRRDDQHERCTDEPPSHNHVRDLRSLELTARIPTPSPSTARPGPRPSG